MIFSISEQMQSWLVGDEIVGHYSKANGKISYIRDV